MFKLSGRLGATVCRKSLSLSVGVAQPRALQRSLSTIKGDQITLWHSLDARSLRCVWTLEEMGVKDYTLITMPFPPRFFHREYLKINVLGTIPFLKDGDATMTESCGISQYLATKYGATELTVAPDSSDYAEYLNWISHADATLTFPQTITLRYSKLEPGRCDVAADDYGKWYLARLRMLDNCLADGRKYLVGDRFTIADICVAYALYVAPSAKLKFTDGTSIADKYTPQVAAYLERMTSRPAFLASRAKQKSSLADFQIEHPPSDK